jgi:hypothetical protein
VEFGQDVVEIELLAAPAAPPAAQPPAAPAATATRPEAG